MKKLKLLFLFLLLPFVAKAYDAYIDGIYYDLNTETQTATVVTYRINSYNSYSGDVNIPETITYNGTTYSVTSIGSSAFSGCRNLTSVTIPNSVISIGDYAFYTCSGLTALTISNSVTSIGYSAFEGCSSLTSVEIPNSVTSIGSTAFENSAWYNNQPDGLVYAGKVAYKYKGTMPSGTSISLEEGTLGIVDAAFYGCSGLTSINIPNSVTSIGYSAFEGCSSLTSVEIPNSVTSIGRSAFSGCSGLTSVTIPNSVTTIGDEAFYGTAWYNNQPDGLVYAGKVVYKYKGTMPSGTSISLEEGTLGIADAAFYGCSGLTSVTIPNSVTSIGWSAFRDCSGLTSVTIGNSVTSIGSRAFSECSGLTSVTIPNSVTSIGDGAFYQCTRLTSVTIGNSVTSIGESAFGSCTGLKSINIPSSVTSIHSWAFDDCSGLSSINVDLGNTKYDSRNNCNGIIETESNTLIVGCNKTVIPNSVTAIGERAFLGRSSMTSITIPNSVISIGKMAFYYCSGLPSIAIPSSVTYIGLDAFYGCSELKSVHIFDLEAWCKITFGSALLEFAHHLYLDGKEITELVIPNSVTSIGGGAFSHCTGLTSVTIPNSVTSIGWGAFGGCSGLTSVTIPNSITTIVDGTFSGCTGLKTVRIGKGIKKIGQRAFAYCQKLEDVWCYAVTCPQETAADAFQDSHIDHVTLHVPQASVKQYVDQVPWNRFGKIERIETPEPSDITLTDAGYATYYDKYFDTELPSGVKACVVTKATDTKLTYKVIADGDRGEVIPAGVAVLLQGARRSADSYTLKPAEPTATYTGANLLHGSDEATTTTADGDCLFYKLAYGPSGTELSKVLGWYWGEDDGRAFTIEGHKAWLAIPKSSSVKQRLFYSIEGNALELESLSLIPSEGEETPNGEWYDLQGRRVTNVTAGGMPALPGIYIRNGKKVYVK